MPISVAWKNTSSTASHCVSFLPCLIPLVHITIVYCLYYSYNFLSCPSNCCLHFKKPAWLITIKSLTKSFLAENDDSTFTSPSSFKTYMSLFFSCVIVYFLVQSSITLLSSQNFGFLQVSRALFIEVRKEMVPDGKRKIVGMKILKSYSCGIEILFQQELEKWLKCSGKRVWLAT